MKSKEMAEVLNLILEKIHPWAAVEFLAVDWDGVDFIAGPRRYRVDGIALKHSNTVPAAFEFDPERETYRITNAATRLEAILRGAVRNDAGELVVGK